jgi:large subunit ribosomal protein L10
MKIEVVKTALFRRAVSESKLAPLGNVLTGPSAIVYGGESAIDISKVLDDWIDKLDGLKIRGAVLEGEYLDEKQCETLSKMPTKRDLQAKVVGVINSPGANLMGAVAGPGRMILGCVKTIIGKLEDGEEVTKVA